MKACKNTKKDPKVTSNFLETTLFAKSRTNKAKIPWEKTGKNFEGTHQAKVLTKAHHSALKGNR